MIEFFVEDIEDVTGVNVEPQLNKKGADILFITPSGDVFADPGTYTCQGYMILFKYLKDKYKTIAAANKLLKTNYRDWSDIKSQQQAAHYLWIKDNSAMLKWEFVRRNFISVFDYIVLHGYAIWNTFVYCFSAVLCALIVNPLAAYALSRFNPPSTYKILLFLMVTMALSQLVLKPMYGKRFGRIIN